MNIEFSKYQGTGNDFIILDNRQGGLSLSKEQVKFLCDRKFGIGADGLMLLDTYANYDFAMKYYNSDGAESTMCGNGGRCLVKFAQDMGIRKEIYHFIATDGMHEAYFDDEGWVSLKMKDVNAIEHYYGDFVLDTGSPHYVRRVNHIEHFDVVNEGRSIRNSEVFAKEGINVNFVYKTEDGIFVRTYERGVEDETLSCGTGVTASALVFAHNDNGFNRVEVKTLGGRLAVEFNKISDTMFKNIWLIGPATFVFKGKIEVPVKL